MGAAEIKILSTHAVFEVLGELAPQFERLGLRPSIRYDPANAIKRLIDAGAAHRGGIEAGLRLGAICLGGLGEVRLTTDPSLPR